MGFPKQLLSLCLAPRPSPLFRPLCSPCLSSCCLGLFVVTRTVSLVGVWVFFSARKICPCGREVCHDFIRGPGEALVNFPLECQTAFQRRWPPMQGLDCVSGSCDS